MILTPENYHSPEARAAYISSSDIKLAVGCEAMWAAQARGLYQRPENTSAFAYGHLFEVALTGGANAYIEAHPELTLSRGGNKGQLRAAYAGALELAAAVGKSPFLSRLIDRCRKQVILTGRLCGMPVRVMMDLLDEDGSIYDLKSARDFRAVWDEGREAYLEWWAVYHYPVQLWVYREIARQNGLTVPQVGIIAGSKADMDVQAIRFGPDTMQAAEADARYTLRRMAAIRTGDAPDACGRCEWCLSQKRITEFEEV